VDIPLERTAAAAAVVVFMLELLVQEVAVVQPMAATVFQFPLKQATTAEVAVEEVEITLVVVVHLIAVMADLELSSSVSLHPKHR